MIRASDHRGSLTSESLSSRGGRCAMVFDRHAAISRSDPAADDPRARKKGAPVNFAKGRLLRPQALWNADVPRRSRCRRGAFSGRIAPCRFGAGVPPSPGLIVVACDKERDENYHAAISKGALERYVTQSIRSPKFKPCFGDDDPTEVQQKHGDAASCERHFLR